jgi:hypothetical protein
VDLHEWDALANVVSRSITAFAVVIGGLWAYLKFVRGRIFARRAELQLAVLPSLSPVQPSLKVTVTMRNTGASAIRFGSQPRYVETFAVTAADWPIDTNVIWGKSLSLTKVFSDHEWIESSEVITESVLVPLPPREVGDGAWVAFRVTVTVGGARAGLRPAPTRWVAATALLATEVRCPDITSRSEVPSEDRL